ncbi:GumC family protein [Trichlorobacter lovleyi]|uniref:GumC family protein n=1 Tax=Trichlorobacter lovleyi TaxID=313985 RepID=UPI0023EF594C|nr:Wzz/FepE/Etk N-terminal domain-containing protein [Trichlorobacter lovleyi]
MQQHEQISAEQQVVSMNQAEDEINLLEYLEVLARNWRMIAKTTAVAALLAVVVSLCLPNIYSATTRILPPQQDSSGLMGMLMGAAGGMGGMAADLLGKGTPADMYVGILSSEAVSDTIIDRFRLMEVYGQKYRVTTYKALDKNVDITAGKKDGIIAITVDDEDPKRAAAIANAYVEELGKLLVKLNITGAGQSRSFYEERLAKARGDLAKAEDALKAFQSKNKIISVSDQAQASISGIAQLKAQQAVQEVQLGTLQRQFTDNSQEVKSAKASIANLRSQIARLEGQGNGGSIPGVGSVPELGQQYLRLMREFKIQETIVELLTKQYEMAKLSEAKDVVAVQVIQAARVPDKKNKPKRSLIVLAATFAAGFGAVLYAFIREAGERMPEEDRQRWKRIRGLLPDLNGLLSRRLRRLVRR